MNEIEVSLAEHGEPHYKINYVKFQARVLGSNLSEGMDCRNHYA